MKTALSTGCVPCHRSLPYPTILGKCHTALDSKGLSSKLAPLVAEGHVEVRHFVIEVGFITTAKFSSVNRLCSRRTDVLILGTGAEPVRTRIPPNLLGEATCTSPPSSRRRARVLSSFPQVGTAIGHESRYLAVSPLVLPMCRSCSWSSPSCKSGFVNRIE